MNRTKAAKEAEIYWNRPCPDGKVYVSKTATIPGTKIPRGGVINIERERLRLNAPKAEGWQARFEPGGLGGPEKLFFFKDQKRLPIQDHGLDDCVHFVSHCLMEGGGLKNEIQWVPTLVDDLINRRNDTKTLAERVTYDTGQRIIATGIMEQGDLVAYYNPEKNPITIRPDYTHSAVYLGEGQIACHSDCRFKDRGRSNASLKPEERWQLNRDIYQYTLIHYTSPSDIDPASAARLSGWWEVTWRGQLYYYYFFKDGRMWYVRARPKNLLLPPGHAENPAYWFTRMTPGPHLAIIYRATGTVERFGLPASISWQTFSKPLPGVWNDSEPLLATKLS